MRIGEFAGLYQLVYKQNDLAKGKVWIFQDQSGQCFEYGPDRPLDEVLALWDKR